MQGVWEKRTGRYESGENYRIGKIIVGGAGYNGVRPKGDPLAYRSVIDLPGIALKNETANFATLEEAKARTEAAVATWFKWLTAQAAKED